MGATISVQYRAVVAPEAPVVAPEEPAREVDLDWHSVLWVLVAFVVFYVIKFPDNSANFVRSAGNALSTAASQLADFVGNLG